MDRLAILQKIRDLYLKVLALRAQLPKQDLFPLVKRKRDEFIALCASKGLPIIVTSGYRSWAEQDALYAQGRTTPGNIVTNARGGQSFHNFGVAFDVWSAGTPFTDDEWNTIGALGQSIGLEWGDRGYVDRPHFQIRMGYSLQDFQNGNVDISKYA